METITCDIPLLIRLLEWAREDAKSDVELHDLAERAIAMKKTILSMKDYVKLIPRKKRVKKTE